MDASTIGPIAGESVTHSSAWRTDGAGRRATSVLQMLGRKLDAHDEGQTRQAAAQLAATLFFQPLLAEMRKSDLGGKFSHGGRGEDVFGEQLDLRVADTVAAANPGGITAMIARKLDRARQPREADTEHPVASWLTKLQAAASKGTDGPCN